MNTPERTPPKMMPIEQDAGQRRDEAVGRAAEARERFGRIAAAHRDHEGRDHQRSGEQEAGQDAGREQVGDRDGAARRRSNR